MGSTKGSLTGERYFFHLFKFYHLGGEGVVCFDLCIKKNTLGVLKRNDGNRSRVGSRGRLAER